jgi:hypothetical protein
MARENAMPSAIGIGDPGSRPEYSIHLSAGTEAIDALLSSSVPQVTTLSVKIMSGITE